MKHSSWRAAWKRDTWLVAFLALVAISLVAYMATGPSDSEDTAPAAVQTAGPDTGPKPGEDGPLGDIARRTEGDPLAIGKLDAPVTLVFFSDFRCPFCAQFSRETEPELVRRYVDTGVLRIEWRDFPVFGEPSMVAARAGRAAASQGKFWEFSRTVYADAPDTGHPDLTPEKLLAYAEQVGVSDLQRFETEMTSTVHDAGIRADMDEGQSLGVPATPTFVVNGTPMLGAQPLEQFTTLVEQAAGAGAP